MLVPVAQQQQGRTHCELMQGQYSAIPAEMLSIQAALQAVHPPQPAPAPWGRARGLWAWIRPQKGQGIPGWEVMPNPFFCPWEQPPSGW